MSYEQKPCALNKTLKLFRKRYPPCCEKVAWPASKNKELRGRRKRFVEMNEDRKSHIGDAIHNTGYLFLRRVSMFTQKAVFLFVTYYIVITHSVKSRVITVYNSL